MKVVLTTVAIITLLPPEIAPGSESDPWEYHLPREHIPYYFNNNPDLKEKCAADENCPYKDELPVKKCWGFEENCAVEDRMSTPDCPDDSRGWTRRKDHQLDHFWKAADYGYIKERRDEMMTICRPEEPDDSLLECAKFTRYCRAKNVYMDFTELNADNSRDRYREDVLKEGQIGGHCKLDKKMLQGQSEHKSPLQSWYAELEHFTSLDYKPIQDKKCDIIIEKPAILIKLDAGVNMYHHFCDYINLYASQHINNSFTKDVQIIMWDTSPMHYGDFFHDTWKAFSDNPIIPLKDFDKKKVCFKDAVFSLLARMRYGLYYNMPLIPGCYGSGLFRAFSQHVLHRLNVHQEGPLESKIRVTLLSRGTKYRKILNEKEIVSAMETIGELDVRVVDYNGKYAFLDQLKSTLNSDIFLGMHGAGLTHLLFLPDWAAVFELYNCEDTDCYLDLARLRGVKYLTWEKNDKIQQEDEGHHPTLGAHAKFTNYAFDVSEFIRLLLTAVKHVQEHKAFIAAHAAKYGPHSNKDEL